MMNDKLHIRVDMLRPFHSSAEMAAREQMALAWRKRGGADGAYTETVTDGMVADGALGSFDARTIEWKI